LLADFGAWLDRERGLPAVTVRCYSKQARAFLAAIGGPVGGLGAGQVTAFMVEYSRDRNSWSAKAMVTSLRAFLRFAHATGRTTALAGAIPAVAGWRLAGLPRGLSAAEIERLLAGCGRETAAGLRDYAVRVAGGVRDRAAALPAADAGGGPPDHGPGLRPGRAGAPRRAPAPPRAGDRDALRS
jgi:integrase/recombinase XerD